MKKTSNQKMEILASAVSKWDKRLKIAFHLIIIVVSIFYSLVLLFARQIVQPIFVIHIDPKFRIFLSFLIFYLIDYLILSIPQKIRPSEIKLAEQYIEHVPIIGAIKVFLDNLGKIAISNTITLILLSYFGF